MDIFRNLCRVCNTEQKQIVNIFKQDVKGLAASVPSMLEYCTGKPAVDDGLKYSSLICFKCIKELEICHRFLRRFNLAQNEFEVAYQIRMEETESFVPQASDVQNEDELVGLELEKQNLQLVAEELKSECPNKRIEYEDPSVLDENMMLRGTDSSSPAVVCCICHKTFFTPKALNLHRKLYHKQKTLIL